MEYLKGSIDINTSNANGLNALHLASKEGHVAVVTELLKRGANVNAATKVRITFNICLLLIMFVYVRKMLIKYLFFTERYSSNSLTVNIRFPFNGYRIINFFIFLKNNFEFQSLD